MKSFLVGSEGGFLWCADRYSGAQAGEEEAQKDQERGTREDQGYVSLHW
jgi:hypothetical protein